jgi:V/A-type H+-transporting ATPase subunit I
VGMMMAVYSLANVQQNMPSDLNLSQIIILIIGNIVVMGLEGLLVAIQVLRLEFYEMFGRYFTGGGKPFLPGIKR